MTIAEQIVQAVAAITVGDRRAIFSRQEIRIQAGVTSEKWKASYSPIFQGMRADQPGRAPDVGDKYKNIFEQVEHGKHILTAYGRDIVAGL